MNETLTQKSPMEREMQMTIAWDDAQETYNTLEAQAAQGVSVKGFRKGKVPADVARAQIDREALLGSTAQELIQRRYEKAVAEASLHVIAPPQVHITKLAHGNDIECTVTISVMPELTLPEDWKAQITAINAEYAKDAVTVDQKDVDAEVERIAQQQATHADVDRAAQDGDQAIIDFVVLRENVPIENGTSKGHALVLGSNAFIPGFEEQIIGMSAGEEKSFELAFPEAYHAKHLAGQTATFQVTIQKVQERSMPTVDDAFAQSLGDFKTVDDLKKSISEGMEQEQASKAKQEKEAKYLDVLTKSIDLELPESVTTQELDKMMREFNQQIAMSGMDMETYLGHVGKTLEELRTEWTPQAEKRVKGAIVLHTLAAELAPEVEHDAVEKEMNAILQYYKNADDAKEKVNMEQLYEHTKARLQNDAVIKELEKM